MGLLFEYVNRDGSFLFDQKDGLFSLGLITVASEGERASYRRRWGGRNYVAVTFASSPGSVLQARGLGLPGGLTSGKTVKFRGLSVDTGASLPPVGCLGHYPKGPQREKFSPCSAHPVFLPFFNLNKVSMRISSGPWLTQRGQGPTARAVRAPEEDSLTLLSRAPKQIPSAFSCLIMLSLLSGGIKKVRRK